MEGSKYEDVHVCIMKTVSPSGLEVDVYHSSRQREIETVRAREEERESASERDQKRERERKRERGLSKILNKTGSFSN